MDVETDSIIWWEIKKAVNDGFTETDRSPFVEMGNHRYLFTGDLVYKDILFAYYPSTDPEAYLVLSWQRHI